MNLDIIIIIAIIFIVYNLQGNIVKKITLVEDNTIGIINYNENLSYFTNLLVKLLDTKVKIKKYKSFKSLIEDLNQNTIQFAVLPENNLVDSALGLSEYKGNVKKNLRFVTGLYYNYQYFITNKIYRDEEKSFQLISPSDLLNFYKIYNRNLILATEKVGSESFSNLMMLLNMYGFKAVNIEKFDKSKKYSENTVFYKTEDIDSILADLLKNRVDGIFINSYYNNTKVRELIDKKDVIFLDLDYQNTIFNDLFSNYFYDKTINISNLEEDLDSVYSFKTKANRLVLVANNLTSEKSVANIVQKYYENNNYLINNLIENKDIHKEHMIFEPIDMIYVNKYIQIHSSAFKYFENLGFIIDEKAKNKLEFITNDKFKHYWKYNKIGLNKFSL